MKAVDPMTERWERKQQAKPKPKAKNGTRAKKVKPRKRGNITYVPVDGPSFQPSVVFVSEPYGKYCPYCAAQDSIWLYSYNIFEQTYICIQCLGAIKSSTKEAQAAHTLPFLKLVYEKIANTDNVQLKAHVMALVLGSKADERSI